VCAAFYCHISNNHISLMKHSDVIPAVDGIPLNEAQSEGGRRKGIIHSALQQLSTMVSEVSVMGILSVL
jgi:hypothetical protein